MAKKKSKNTETVNEVVNIDNATVVAPEIKEIIEEATKIENIEKELEPIEVVKETKIDVEETMKSIEEEVVNEIMPEVEELEKASKIIEAAPNNEEEIKKAVKQINQVEKNVVTKIRRKRVFSTPMYNGTYMI